MQYTHSRKERKSIFEMRQGGKRKMAGEDSVKTKSSGKKCQQAAVEMDNAALCHTEN